MVFPGFLKAPKRWETWMIWTVINDMVDVHQNKNISQMHNLCSKNIIEINHSYLKCNRKMGKCKVLAVSVSLFWVAFFLSKDRNLA